MINIITHRGLDPSKDSYFAESSKEAFEDQLKRGYGLEFDVRRTKDNKLVVVHDSNLKRLTHGLDERSIADLLLVEILQMDFNGSHLASLNEVFNLITNLQAPDAISALHLKAASQERGTLDLLMDELSSVDVSKIILFDVKIETARYLKGKMPNLKLVPSVAHPYDIQRYGQVTGNTLLYMEQVLAEKDLFHGVWLDEWDRADTEKKTKIFYSAETFAAFRSAGLKIYLVTPELHSQSPGLIGGEAHEDAVDHSTLMHRIKQILALEPDGVCTDYPDEVYGLIR